MVEYSMGLQYCGLYNPLVRSPVFWAHEVVSQGVLKKGATTVDSEESMRLYGKGKQEWQSRRPEIAASGRLASGILTLDELAGAFGGADNGFDKSNAQAAFLKFDQSVNGAAGGCGDHVF